MEKGGASVQEGEEKKKNFVRDQNLLISMSSSYRPCAPLPII